MFKSFALSIDDTDTFSCRYINSMPMIFAFRIVDCFFCMGPKVLFQVGYVISTSLVKLLKYSYSVPCSLGKQ